MGAGATSIPKRTRQSSETVADPIARFLLESVDGRRRVEDLADCAFIDVEHARRIVEQLERSGHLAPPPSPDRESDPLGVVQKLRIESFLTELDRLTHYEVLGVSQDADKAFIKRAYFQLSKEFHPDTQFGKSIGEFRSKMEKLFRTITEAHDVLTRPKRRAEYDDDLRRRGRGALVIRLHPDWAALADSAEAQREATGKQLVGAAPSSLGTDRAVAQPISKAVGLDASTRPVSGSAARPAAPVAGTAAHATPTSDAAGMHSARVSPSVVSQRPNTMRAAVVMPPPDARPSSAGAARPVVTAHAPASAPGSARLPVSSPLPPASSSPSTPRLPSTPPPAARPASVMGAPRPPSRGREDDTRPISTRSAYGQRIAQDLARQVGRPMTPPTAPDHHGGAPHGDRVEQRDLFRAVHDSQVHTGPGDRGLYYQRLADESEKQGDLAGAIARLRMLLQHDPARIDVAQRVAGLEQRVAAGKADENRARARAEERGGRNAQAAAAWANVALGLPRDLEALVGAARCLLAADGDLRQARDFAQKAADLSPTNVEARVLLARVYQRANMSSNARREAEAASKLDPGNQLVKNLLRELK